MQLTYSPASPFVRKVMVVLHETGQLDDVEIIDTPGTPLDAEPSRISHNPLGKIPALSRPDGPSIYDSRVICQFLNARAGAKLYPASRQWEVLTLEATADGIMDAAVSMAYEVKCRSADMQSQDWMEAQWGKVMRALDAVTAKWLSHLNGPLDAAQIAMACALGYLDLRHDVRNWRQGHDKLAVWYADFAERPAMKATVPV